MILISKLKSSFVKINKYSIINKIKKIIALKIRKIILLSLISKIKREFIMIDLKFKIHLILQIVLLIIIYRMKEKIRKKERYKIKIKIKFNVKKTIIRNQILVIKRDLSLSTVKTKNILVMEIMKIIIKIVNKKIHNIEVIFIP